MSMKKRILIIEDDSALNQMLGFHFEENGFEVDSAGTLEEAHGYLEAHAVDIILLDQHLPDGTGMQLLLEKPEVTADAEVIMLTGQHDLELAIDAIKQGAADFIHKPVNIDSLQHAVGKAMENRMLSRQVRALQAAQTSTAAPRELIGRGEAMLQISKEIALCANSGATVLITGESGTGKEVVARLIHQHSGRNGPFIAINCAAIVDNLLESELFGHEKGSFTGANVRKAGKFELAQDGTMFLDEIGELAPNLQAKLLRVLQENVYERVGGTQLLQTNARIIAATNRNLFEEAAAGRFREDLAYRLDVIAIHLPPLRERLEDIPLLAKSLMARIAETIHRPQLALSDAAIAKLSSYHWPGNVRELENVLTQAMVRARAGVLSPDLLNVDNEHAPQTNTGAVTDNTNDPTKTLEQVESEYIQRVLTHCGGHKGKTCKLLNISRPALDRKIAKFDLHLK